MKTYIWRELSASEQLQVLERPALSHQEELTKGVREILATVRREGRAGLIRLTEKFDRVTLRSLKVSAEEFEASEGLLPSEDKCAMKLALENLLKFHGDERPKDIGVDVMPGVRAFRQFRPIERVGLYVPGGSAPLPSTVLMLGVPAGIAGAPLKVICTPPRPDDTIHPSILYAAKLVGISEIYKLGGAQAIGALAYGVGGIPKVDKIFGPGNAWVTEAKAQVSNDPLGALSDLPAGPSEVLVIADQSADPTFAAADLLSQAEHGPDSQALLVATERAFIERTQVELARQLAELPRREIAEQAMRGSLWLLAADLDEAFAISNAYAPEHLILQVENAASHISKIFNAGSVFLGRWTCESLGDYASGTNHVLPTYGYARSISGLGVESFGKQITFQEVSAEGLGLLGPAVERFARCESLEGHARAVSVRLQAASRKRSEEERL